MEQTEKHSMNICIVNHSFFLTDGQGRVNYKLAENLARMGHTLTLISPGIDPRLAGQDNIHWREVTIPDWCKTNLLRFQMFAWAVQRILQKEHHQFDIVHLNGFITNFPADVNASHFVHANWLKSPYQAVNSYRDLYHRLYTVLNSHWERSAYASARKVVAVSDFVRKSLIHDVGVLAENVEVVFNGVDIEEFRPLRPGEANALREELHLPSEAFLCLFVGDLRTNRKNFGLVLEAITRLPSRFQLAVAGYATGTHYASLVTQRHLTERVHFLGHRSDVPTLLRGADAFVFASHYDPCPLVILEALASGVPVITAPTVGNSTVIDDAKNGFVLRDSQDIAGMTRILEQLADEPEFAKYIGNSARKTAEGMSWEAMAQNYELIYRSILIDKQKRNRSNCTQPISA